MCFSAVTTGEDMVYCSTLSLMNNDFLNILSFLYFQRKTNAFSTKLRHNSIKNKFVPINFNNLDISFSSCNFVLIYYLNHPYQLIKHP